ncbi:MAG: replication initiator protein [Microvirus sp.]|nr:MAG: replication initiator protein [Microvirus sp.]
MACFHPLTAFQTEDGLVVFHEKGKIRRELSLPCGRCVGCRLVRSRSWAIRCVHEAQCHDVSIFVTLTYDESHYAPSLEYRDFQLFIKRLRKRFGRVRFFACGEYGEENFRPHFHALLFGITFSDAKKIGESLYRSPTLEELWPYGMSSFGAVTFQSAGYVARYCVKKVSGPAADDYYKRVCLTTGEIVPVVPEFGRMSLKPGIGYPWFEKFWRDVYQARDGVVVQGKVLPAPRYYDQLLDRVSVSLSTEKEFDRYINSEKFKDDCVPDRLAVREIVAKARLNTLRRNL